MVTAGRLSHARRVSLCPMRKAILLLTTTLLLGCGGGSEDRIGTDQISRQPLSVRGWVLDVKGSAKAPAMEMEIARRQELFQAASIWVENSPFSSGGIAENGAFVVLDVAPPNAIIGFNAPGAENAQLVLENIPGSADVFVPDVILESGGATVADPSKILVRVAARVDAPRRTGKTARVAGHEVPVIEAPLSHFRDRRDYPNPGGYRPVAVVK